MTYSNPRHRDLSPRLLVAIFLTGVLLTSGCVEDPDHLGESVANLRWDPPESLITEHIRWHTLDCEEEGGRACEDTGADFLEFHRGYLRRLRTAGQFAGLSEAQMAPWETVPDEVQNTPVFSDGALQSLERLSVEDPSTFCGIASSLNDFGTFVESRVHNAMHGGAFDAIGSCGDDFDSPDDCVIGGFMSPKSTLFFQIHGLVEHWHTRYRNECL